jgi:hypothetical protein
LGIFLQNRILGKWKKHKIILVSIGLFLIVLIRLAPLIISTQIMQDKSSNFEFKNPYDVNLKISNGEDYLFQGIEDSLIINDTGNLYNLNQEISASNQVELNLTYYLDDVHKWKASKIQTNIRNIQDTREWVQSNDYYKLDIPYRHYKLFSNDDPPGNPPHNYSLDLDHDPTNPSNIHSTISNSSAEVMRLHFSRIEIETDWDLLCIYDKNNRLQFTFTGMAADFYTPWMKGDTFKITINSDSSIEWYGYDIDYYEYYNSSTNYFDYESSWGYNNRSIAGIFGENFGIGEIDNNTAMYTILISEPGRDTDDPMDATYYENDFSEIYQNISIPRGSVIDAYISFDYYAESAMDSNENYIYCEINNKKIYSKGLGDIVDAGKKVWHNTGRIYLDLWSNTSKIFNNIKNNYEFNISVGIKSGATVTYSGFDDRFQQIFWFDNISLILTTLCNSTQTDINLTINQNNLFDDNYWGISYRNFTASWETNPIVLTVETVSPSLDFELDTVIYGYHETTSKIGQTTQEGSSFQILKNDSVYWEFTHNFYMPSQYSDFAFRIVKPLNWKFISVLDPTLGSIAFEGGDIGDSYLKINKTNALFPGWWTFTATSPNYLNISNTLMLKEGIWTNPSFITGESTKIKTQINNSNEIPPNLLSTSANLTIYDPIGSVWYEESKNPFSNGTVIFSSFTFSAINTLGGQYNYTIIWSNGTAVGGVQNEFILNHQSSLTLLKPDDAKLDHRAEGFVGDIIPIRILLKDSENNYTISNAVISFNWTDGNRYFTESALGIYETVIDTADLLSRGLYAILINSSKEGFFTSNITFEINLGEKTNLQVLESEYNIELHANSTIRFKFSDFDGDAIDGALVNISITNQSLYSISNTGLGIYNIEFSTLFIDDIGIYQLNINFSATAYEPQHYIYQFQIVQQSVNLSTYLFSQQMIESSLVETTFNTFLNISVKAISNIDKELLSGGLITFIRGNYQKNLTEFGNFWYNVSIFCSPANFTLGINLVYLKFEHPNYRTATFSFQILIDQIEISVDPSSFEDSITADIGDTINVEIILLDPITNHPIENASVSYTWDYGIGTINETTLGIYQIFLELPENLEGNFRFNLIIIPEGIVYKTTQFSFIVIIGEPSEGPTLPNYLLWIIIGVLVSIVSALGILSLRSYVILPRKRRKEAALLSKTQRFKDLKNIQAIVVIHKLSGIPLFSKSYSILEKHKKELFSGFIQAITMIGEEFAEKKVEKPEIAQPEKVFGVEKMIELNFKQFYCLIADVEELRVVFILKEKSSDRLKGQVSNLVFALNLKLSKELEDWDGSLDDFEILVPEILSEYFELYYKESFKLSPDTNLITLRKERKVRKMEMRVINVIQSMSKDNLISDINNIVELVHEENKDLIIEAIESLIKQKVIIPVDN